MIRNRNGAIIKTIGDAVMAVFENAADATNAAFEMIDALTSLTIKFPGIDSESGHPPGDTTWALPLIGASRNIALLFPF